MHADRIVAKMEKVLQAKQEAAKAVGEDTPNSICTDTYSVNGNKVRFFYSREAESGVYQMSMEVNGKMFSKADEIRDMVLKVDGYNLATGERIKKSLSDSLRKDAPVLRRTAAVAVIRKAETTVKESQKKGETILGTVLGMILRGTIGKGGR